MSTATAAAAQAASSPASTLARPAGLVADTVNLAGRQLRCTVREPFALIPALIIPVFFFFVNTGSLSGAVQAFAISNPEAFFLPVSVLFATSNGGAGLRVVGDIESGYFDKLLLTPTRRIALLVGLMGAEFFVAAAQATIVTLVAWLAGATFGLGLPGAAGMVLLAALWGLVYAGIGYAIALKTGNAAATQSAFVLFFPFIFLTESFLPAEAFEGWLQTAAQYNPVTYLLRGLRALVLEASFDERAVGLAALAVVGVGVLTMGAALTALRGRVR